MTPAQAIVTRRALRTVTLMPWLVAAVAAAGFVWAVLPSFIYPATPRHGRARVQRDAARGDGARIGAADVNGPTIHGAIWEGIPPACVREAPERIALRELVKASEAYIESADVVWYDYLAAARLTLALNAARNALKVPA